MDNIGYTRKRKAKQSTTESTQYVFDTTNTNKYKYGKYYMSPPTNNLR
jgi:hypothetical protein